MDCENYSGWMHPGQFNYAKIFLHNSKSDDKMTYCMTKLTARQRILDYLSSHHGVTAADIARALRVTPANIRHHLGILIGDGRIQVLGMRSGEGPGRPQQVVGLSDAALGEHLSGLAAALLDEWLSGMANDAREEALRAIALRISQPAKQGPLTLRLARVQDALNKMGYQARWEAHAMGPRIIFGHCPYAAIIANHPELCRVDAFLLENQLGRPAVQLAKLEKNERGLPLCVFAIPQ